MQKLFVAVNLFEVVILSMTDGLLVGLTQFSPSRLSSDIHYEQIWRCYMVHKVFEHSSARWRNIFWAFPACLWVLNIGTNSLKSKL